MAKTLTRKDIKSLIQNWKAKGEKVALTSGAFDLLHAGHLDYLIQAKQHCDRLVVAVNSDASIRQYKDPSRPIVSESYRAELIRGLKPVDEVFIFEELNNNKNIEELQPDVYIKAGDYQESQLSSAPLVKSYGGQIVLIPLKHPTSTSHIIETVLARTLAQYQKVPPQNPRPAIFLDRDGVICEHIEYLHEPDKFKLTPKCSEALKSFQEAGYALIVVTNQPGISLGYFSHEDFYAVNRAMFRALKGSGIIFDKIYYSPYSEGDQSDCRKPNPGMLKRAQEELPLIKEGSWMIGDNESDIEAGHRFGIPSLLIHNNRETKTKAEFIASNLFEAAEYIIKESAPL